MQIKATQYYDPSLGKVPPCCSCWLCAVMAQIDSQLLFSVLSLATLIKEFKKKIYRMILFLIIFY